MEIDVSCHSNYMTVQSREIFFPYKQDVVNINCFFTIHSSSITSRENLRILSSFLKLQEQVSPNIELSVPIPELLSSKSYNCLGHRHGAKLAF